MLAGGRTRKERHGPIQTLKQILIMNGLKFLIPEILFHLPIMMMLKVHLRWGLIFHFMDRTMTNISSVQTAGLDLVTM